MGTLISRDFEDISGTQEETVRRLDRGWTGQRPKPSSPLRKTVCKPGIGRVHTAHVKMAVGERDTGAAYLTDVVEPFLVDTTSAFSRILPMSERGRQ